METLKGESAQDTCERLRRERPDVHILSIDVIMESPNPLKRLFEMIDEQDMVCTGKELMMRIVLVRKLMEQKARGEWQ